MPHWRTLVKSEYFCAADLWDDQTDGYRKAIFRIVKVMQGTVVGEKGRKRGLPFLWLEDIHGKPQRAPFGANPTNCGFIEQALGTGDYKKWVGQWIGLYVSKVDSPKGLVDAIRVHAQRVHPPDRKSSEQKSQPPAEQQQQQADVRPASSEASTELTEADKRAIEMAEREEANRGH